MRNLIAIGLSVMLMAGLVIANPVSSHGDVPEKVTINETATSHGDVPEKVSTQESRGLPCEFPRTPPLPCNRSQVLAQMSCLDPMPSTNCIGFGHLNLILDNWGMTGVNCGDFDGDGDVDQMDMDIVLNCWGACYIFDDYSHCNCTVKLPVVLLQAHPGPELNEHHVRFFLAWCLWDPFDICDLVDDTPCDPSDDVNDIFDLEYLLDHMGCTIIWEDPTACVPDPE